MKVYKVIDEELWNEFMHLYRAKYSKSKQSSAETKTCEQFLQSGGSSQITPVSPTLSRNYWTDFEAAVQQLKTARRPQAKKQKRQTKR